MLLWLTSLGLRWHNRLSIWNITATKSEFSTLRPAQNDHHLPDDLLYIYRYASLDLNELMENLTQNEPVQHRKCYIFMIVVRNTVCEKQAYIIMKNPSGQIWRFNLIACVILLIDIPCLLTFHFGVFSGTAHASWGAAFHWNYTTKPTGGWQRAAWRCHVIYTISSRIT